MTTLDVGEPQEFSNVISSDSVSVSATRRMAGRRSLVIVPPQRPMT
jgi:hypothetical protein